MEGNFRGANFREKLEMVLRIGFHDSNPIQGHAQTMMQSIHGFDLAHDFPCHKAGSAETWTNSMR